MSVIEGEITLAEKEDEEAEIDAAKEYEELKDL